MILQEILLLPLQSMTGMRSLDQRSVTFSHSPLFFDHFKKLVTPLIFGHHQWLLVHQLLSMAASTSQQLDDKLFSQKIICGCSIYLGFLRGFDSPCCCRIPYKNVTQNGVLNVGSMVGIQRAGKICLKMRIPNIKVLSLAIKTKKMATCKSKVFS